MSKKILVILSLILILGVSVFMYFLKIDNKKITNRINKANYNQVQQKVIYSDEELDFTKSYGDIVSKFLNYQNNEYKLIEEYNSNNTNQLKTKIRVFKNNNENILKICAYELNNEKNLLSEMYVTNNSCVFLNYSDDNKYGFLEEDKFICFDTQTLKTNEYENPLVLEQYLISTQLSKKENQDFDDISKNIIKIKKAKSIEEFIPKEYELISEFSIDGYINDDELIDSVVVLERKDNYIKSDDYYAFPRIGLLLLKDNENNYVLNNFVSNLIAPKSNIESIEDSFKGFSLKNRVLIAKNEFHFPSESRYIQKFRLDENNKLQLIGYTRANDSINLENEENPIYATFIDYNLITGEVYIVIENKDLQGNSISKNTYTTTTLKKSSYYDKNIYYNTNLKIIDELEKKHIKMKTSS